MPCSVTHRGHESMNTTCITITTNKFCSSSLYQKWSTSVMNHVGISPKCQEDFTVLRYKTNFILN